MRAIIAARPQFPATSRRTHHWTRSTAISFAAELDGHVLGAMRSHHGVTHQSTRAMHPRVIRGRQIQVNGRPHPRPAGTWCNRQPKNVHVQGKLWHPLLRWPAPMARPPIGVLGRIGRLVGDQERNKSSYSHTKFDIQDHGPTRTATGKTSPSWTQENEGRC